MLTNEFTLTVAVIYVGRQRKSIARIRGAWKYILFKKSLEDRHETMEMIKQNWEGKKGDVPETTDSNQYNLVKFL